MAADPADLPPDRQHPDDVCMCGHRREEHLEAGLCRYSAACLCQLFRLCVVVPRK